MAIPLFASSLAPYQDAIAEKLREVAASGRYILGPEVKAFEDEFAAWLGAANCVGVGNGTDALQIALRASGVGPGDDVVMPSFTFYATAEAAATLGARPVFCDIDPATFCVTAETVERALTPNTKAVIPVHLFGNVAPIDELRELGVPVIEDAAQAAGSTYKGANAGSLGDVATFSFFPSKNFPCLGDGGAVITDDDEVGALARRLRFHGSTDKQTYTEVGWNSRLDAIHAATMRLLLPELDGWTDARRGAASMYEQAGLGDLVQLPQPTPGSEPAWHLYVVRHERADELVAGLNEAGVEARVYYRVPVHRQPAMAEFGNGDLPGTEEAARTNFAVPMGTGLHEGQVEQVVHTLRTLC
ncbi:MAG TPA: DegT/DnrJ/EryC1/StrS family aminotransferase [Thermoleophilaceae bacterium]|nr:DegT/DnrJ/EryC1/StrS family aminotransferase [Thermoleophilaceae bacterium]